VATTDATEERSMKQSEESVRVVVAAATAWADALECAEKRNAKAAWAA